MKTEEILFEHKVIFLSIAVYVILVCVVTLYFIIKDGLIKNSETKKIFKQYAQARAIEYTFEFDDKTGGINFLGDFIPRQELEKEAVKMILNRACMAMKQEEESKDGKTKVTKKLYVIWEKQ